MLQPFFTLASAGSFCWFVTSSLWIYPHSLSYFNESIGGPLNGPEHLLGSAVDWGQDLRYLAQLQEELPSDAFIGLESKGISSLWEIGLLRCLPINEPAVCCLDLVSRDRWSNNNSERSSEQCCYVMSVDMVYGTNPESPTIMALKNHKLLRERAELAASMVVGQRHFDLIVSRKCLDIKGF